MATRYMIKDKYSGEYLASKFMRGYYLTTDISQAIKCKSNHEAIEKADHQDIRRPESFAIVEVNFA